MSNIKEQLPTLAEIKQQLARKLFFRFVLYTMPTYQAEWFHIEICNKLQQFAEGKIKKLMLFVPPQHGKSQLSSRHLPAYLLGAKPDKKIALAGYATKFTHGFMRDVKRLMSENEYKEIFPQTKLPTHASISSNTNDLLELPDYRGSLRCVGIDGPLTGNTVDIGIIDDPFKSRAEAMSETIRENVWQWYVSVFCSRLHNNSQQLLLFTRWHEDDLAGRLLAIDAEKEQRGEAREWEVIKFPAIKEQHYTAPNDPRMPGEALWESMHSAAKTLEQKLMDSTAYNSLYQQDPQPLQGNILDANNIESVTWGEFNSIRKNRFVKWNFVADTAYTTKTYNDASALLGYCMLDNSMYIRIALDVRMEFNDLCEWLEKTVRQHGYSGLSQVEIEPKANGKSIVQSMRKSTSINISEYKFPRYEGVRLDDKDKITRASAITSVLNSKRVYIVCEKHEQWPDRFRKQCNVFPNGTNDDIVDTLIMAVAKEFFQDRKKIVTNANG
jgi:predicted phage terminase large subunit-like protein